MKDSKKKWIFTAILVAIEVFMTVTNLGYYTFGSTAFTVLHIPAFIATILIGLPQGVLIAGIFGLSSLISSYLFASGSLDYLFQNPFISVVPRLMVPFAVWILYKVVCHIADDNTVSAKVICSSLASVCGVIANAAFVIISIAILLPEAIGITDSFSASTIVVTNIIAKNIFFEIAASIIAVSLTILILNKINWLDDTTKTGVIPGNIEENEEPYLEKPIRKTFRKWLLLFMVLINFFILVFLYNLLSLQDLMNAQTILHEKAGDICNLIENTGTSDTGADLKIGVSGYAVIAEDDIILDTGLNSLEVVKLSDLAKGYDQMEPDTANGINVNGVPGSGLVKIVNNYTVLTFLPDSEIYAGRDKSLSMLLAGLIFFFLLLFELISELVQRNVVQKIQEVNGSLGEIRAGNLDEKVTVSGNTEFVELSLGINTTVDALKETMREIAEKNRAEMEFAREVQNASLPSGSLTGHGVYGFSVLGSMKAAREVGGDFYDYFLIGEDKLGFLVADVSGKGVPAALFMMRAKTLINNFVLEGKSPAEALQRANVELCANNESGMFVTVWLGVLELDSGTLEFANAAHNPPLLMKAGESFTYMDHKTYRRGLVLAGLEETRYRNNVIFLSRGDMLFLYTDGVTEATNRKMELYGEKRLQECLDENYMLEPADLIRAVRSDIDRFAAGTEQYDDITMLVLRLE